MLGDKIFQHVGALCISAWPASFQGALIALRGVSSQPPLAPGHSPIAAAEEPARRTEQKNCDASGTVGL